MSVWFTADLHLGHRSIVGFCNRPFLSEAEAQQVRDNPRGKIAIGDDTVQAHDRALIDGINDRVRPEDELWILGDFAWGGYEKARRYRERIHCGTVHFIRGNHDGPEIDTLFTTVADQRTIRVQGQTIFLSHYPARSWDGSFHGSWSLYGHVHGRLEAEDAANPWMLTRDVGVDNCDYQPWSFEQLQAYMQPRTVAHEKRLRAFKAGDVNHSNVT